MGSVKEMEVPVNEGFGGFVRLSVNIPVKTMAMIRDLAEREQVTITEVVRRAISAERFLRDQFDEGKEILIKEKGKAELTQLVMFR